MQSSLFLGILSHSDYGLFDKYRFTKRTCSQE